MPLNHKIFPPFAGLILTGGGSTRMGADKASACWRGERAVDLVWDLALEVLAGPVLTVGKEDYALPFVPDDAPLGGPVGGILAGARALRGQNRVLVLAVDAPTVEPDDLMPLMTAPYPSVAFETLHLPLVLDLGALPPDARADWPIARLAEAMGVVRIPCPEAARIRMRGANTPEERALLLAARAWPADKTADRDEARG